MNMNNTRSYEGSSSALDTINCIRVFEKIPDELFFNFNPEYGICTKKMAIKTLSNKLNCAIRSCSRLNSDVGKKSFDDHNIYIFAQLH